MKIKKLQEYLFFKVEVDKGFPTKEVKTKYLPVPGTDTATKFEYPSIFEKNLDKLGVKRNSYEVKEHYENISFLFERKDIDKVKKAIEFTRNYILQEYNIKGIISNLLPYEESVKVKPEIYKRHFNKQYQERTFAGPGIIREEVDVDEIINELINTGWSGDNKSQMKAVQLLKGLATSDDPKANDFMKKLDNFTSSLKSKKKENFVNNLLENRSPKYDWNPKFLEGVNKLILMMWPQESKRLDFIRKKMVNNESPKELENEYYDLKSFLRESLIGSISRYWAPMSKD